MTDEQIIRALEHTDIISKSFREELLALIKIYQQVIDELATTERRLRQQCERQKAEIENYSITEKDLRYRNKELQRANKKQAEYIEELESELNANREIRAEAIKEFAEGLKEDAINDEYGMIVGIEDIDNLVKEMIGEQNDENL